MFGLALFPRRSPVLSHWPLLGTSALKPSKPSVGFDLLLGYQQPEPAQISDLDEDKSWPEGPGMGS